MNISFNSAIFFRLLCRILFFSVPQRFSIGLKSGDWLGNWRTLIFPLLNHSRLGSLSSWNVHLCFFNKSFAFGMRLLQYMTIHGTIHLCINDVEYISAMRGKTSPNHYYTTTSVRHRWYGIFTVIRCLLIPPNITSGIATEMFNFGVIRVNDSLPILISFQNVNDLQRVFSLT